MAMKPSKDKLSWSILVAGAVVFMLGGLPNAFKSAPDLVPLYTGASCFTAGCNPYDTHQLEQQYLQRGGRLSDLPPWYSHAPVYPPSTILAMWPLTTMALPQARVAWAVLNVVAFLAGSFCIFAASPKSHPRLVATLIALVLATSGKTLLGLGQPVTITIAALTLGVPLLIYSRFLPFAAFMLTVALTFKPQMAVLIVLFLLVRRIHTPWVLAAAGTAFTVLIVAASLLSIRPGSASWQRDWQRQIATSIQPGATNDPRPDSQNAVSDVNLQAITSIFSADARVFNALAYVVFGITLVIWAAAAWRNRIGPSDDIIAIAAVSVISLLPFYHRAYDTRILLLTIPVIPIVVAKDRTVGSVIAVLTGVSLISFQSYLQIFTPPKVLAVIQHNTALLILLLREQNLALLLLAATYIAVMLKASQGTGPLLAAVTLQTETSK